MKKSSQKNKRQPKRPDIDLNERTIKDFCPGAFEIIDSSISLFEARGISIGEKQQSNTMLPLNDVKSLLGIMGSFLILLGHTTELLLKLKIQLDGRKIHTIHNLHTLFNDLNEDSKHQIEAEYRRLKDRKFPRDTTWISVDLLFTSHPEYHVTWRYVAEKTGKLDTAYPFLRIAAESIYNTVR